MDGAGLEEHRRRNSRRWTEVLRRVEERAKITPKGAWIRGHGWNQNVWGGVFPTKADLDRVAPEHPVYLTAKSGHAAWANSLALKIAGITPSTPNPTGGEIVRDAAAGAGRTDRHLLRRCDGIGQQDSSLSHQRSKWLTRMRDALPLFQRAGLTGVHDFDGARALQAWQILKENGELNFRVSKTIPVALQEHAIALGIRSGFGDDWLRINSVKSFCRRRARPADRADDRSLRRHNRQSRHQHAATKKRCSRTCARPARRGCRPPFTPSATRPITMCWMCLRWCGPRRSIGTKTATRACAIASSTCSCCIPTTSIAWRN